MKLIIHTEAQAELDEAAIWYEHQQASLGVEFRNAVNEALDRLAGGLTTGSTAEGFEFESGIRRIGLGRFPYSVVYDDVAIPDSIYVLAFVHQKRKPRYGCRGATKFKSITTPNKRWSRNDSSCNAGVFRVGVREFR